MLEPSKSSVATVSSASVVSWVTSVVLVPMSTVGQLPASKVSPEAADRTVSTVRRKPSRLKKKGSLRGPANTRTSPLALTSPAAFEGFPST